MVLIEPKFVEVDKEAKKRERLPRPGDVVEGGQSSVIHQGEKRYDESGLVEGLGRLGNYGVYRSWNRRARCI